ncbi:hypothetical protein [Marivita sp.]|uniref:hypothetical protein n=1 Tax=Marivita sp. TaxID=2003365 RepID=UPI003B5C8807
MPQTESLIWIILACTGTICVISMLGVFANVMSYETQLHDLRNRVAELQYTYALRLARLHGHVKDDEVGQVDIVDEKTGKIVEPAQAQPAPAPQAADETEQASQMGEEVFDEAPAAAA